MNNGVEVFLSQGLLPCLVDTVAVTVFLQRTGAGLTE